MSYEFTPSEDKIIAGVGVRGIIITIIILIGSVLDLVVILTQSQGQGIWRLASLIALLLTQIIIGAVFFLPANNFRNVAKTQGNDVNELMIGISKFLKSVNVMVYALIFGTILLFIMLFM